jgi:hypothetical protein
MATMYGVKRTTIYLPERLKADIERIATQTGRTEADLIREGAELVVAGHDAPRRKPTLGIMHSEDPSWLEPENLERLMDEGFGQD